LEYQNAYVALVLSFGYEVSVTKLLNNRKLI